MEWRDDALVLGLKPHGETGTIVDVLTRERGRHLGFVQGGRSRRLRPVLQPGNSVVMTWRARVEEQLGTVTLEPLVSRAAWLMASVTALQGANLVCALLRLLPEREPQPAVHALAEAILDHLEDSVETPRAIVRLELALLAELGFGLDLSRCALTGSTEDLAFVSPRTGRAVTRQAGAPYRDRVLPLPGYLLGAVAAQVTLAELEQGFALTEHFLLRDVLGPRGLPMPECRRAYVAAVLKTASRGSLVG